MTEPRVHKKERKIRTSVIYTGNRLTEQNSKLGQLSNQNTKLWTLYYTICRWYGYYVVLFAVCSFVSRAYVRTQKFDVPSSAITTLTGMLDNEHFFGRRLSLAIQTLTFFYCTAPMQRNLLSRVHLDWNKDWRWVLMLRVGKNHNELRIFAKQQLANGFFVVLVLS